MEIDGQCHCGRVTYRAEIDPAKVSICHCTDCQNLTGSPYRVTVICSEASPHDGRAGEGLRQDRRQRPHALPAFLRGLWFPAVHQRRRRAGRLGHPLGQIRQRDQLKPARQIWCRPPRHGSTISGICRDGRATDATGAWPSNPCIKGGRRAKQAAQGRLAQLVRASRLHREGRQFESVAAYQPSRFALRLGKPAGRSAKAVTP